MRQRAPAAVLFLLPSVLFAFAEAAPPRRVALVMGNETYPAAPLRNAVNDAKSMAEALQKAGFEVSSALNTDLRSMERAIDGFVAGIRSGDVALVFYAGHGIQLNGENYLVPVDFAPKDEADAKYVSYSASRLHDRVEGAGSGLTIVVLDACRTNPFRATRSQTSGLAPMNTGKGSFIAFATAPGKTASDNGSGRNGLFTGSLLEVLVQPGQNLDQVFNTVRERVYAASGGLQLPWTSSSVVGDFYFHAPSRVAAKAPQPPSPDRERELAAWSAARDAQTPEPLEQYLKTYPSGQFASAASDRLASFTRTAPKPGSTKTATKKVQLRPPDLELKEPFVFGKPDVDLWEQCELLDRKLEKDGLVWADKELDTYLAQIGNSILPPGQPPERVRWRFRALRDPMPNAFAMPNGSIYVHSGLLATMENESQLASVLAHEITHVTGRHTYLDNRSRRKKSVAIHVLQAAAAWAPVDTSWGFALNVVGTIVPVVLVNTINGYTRELERQADAYALYKLADTGYDPAEMGNTFRLLQRKIEVETNTIYYNDHPKLEDRIAYVNAFTESDAVKSAPGLWTVHREQYVSGVDRICRHNIRLAIDSGRRRTAWALSKRLFDASPRNADAALLMGEAYLALGPFASQVTPAELTRSGKKDAAKRQSRMTFIEEEHQLMASASGQSAWQENRRQAEEFYRKSLELDPGTAAAHRGLGMLYEKDQDKNRAIEEYRTYLKMSPDASDRQRIVNRIEGLEKTLKGGRS